MKKHIYDEKNRLSYTLQGDYYLPDLNLPEEKEATYGKYGMLRKIYMKEYRQSYYQTLVLQGRLNEYLNQVDAEAHDKLEILMAQMAEKQGVTEQLKAEQPMLWAQRMNGIRTVAEKMVLTEIIYE